MFWAADVRARGREVVRGTPERARAKMKDVQAVGRATGNGSGEMSKDFRVGTMNGRTTTGAPAG